MDGLWPPVRISLIQAFVSKQVDKVVEFNFGIKYF